jgi:large subunit ribosomal protein L29
MQKAKELRLQAAQELVELERNKRQELFELKNKCQKEKKREPAKVRSLKREIAQVLTVLREKELTP